MSGRSDEPGNGESESGEGSHGIVREKGGPERSIASGQRRKATSWFVWHGDCYEARS